MFPSLRARCPRPPVAAHSQYVTLISTGKAREPIVAQWRTRAVVLTCGRLILMLAIGLRQAFGLTFLGTVTVTNALVTQIFGVRYLSTLIGIAFFAHQPGGFLGAWSGGLIFDASGSYTVVWLVCAGLSAVAALACWPIDERYVGTAAAQSR